MNDQNEVQTFPCPRCKSETTSVWHIPSDPVGWCIHCFDDLMARLDVMESVESCDECPCGTQSTDRWDEPIWLCGHYDKIFGEEDFEGGKKRPDFCKVASICVLVRPDVRMQEKDATQWYAVNGDGTRVPIDSPVDPKERS